VVPPHVDYTLSPLGLEAAQRIETLTDWIEMSLPRFMAARREKEVEKENQASK